MSLQHIKYPLRACSKFRRYELKRLQPVEYKPVKPVEHKPTSIKWAIKREIRFTRGAFL